MGFANLRRVVRALHAPRPAETYRPSSDFRVEPLEARVLLTTIVVSSFDDGGPGSLRQAIIDANSDPAPATILLPAGTYTLDISGAGEDAAATGDLDILADLTIVGDGAGVTVIDAGGIGGLGDRVFEVHGVSLEMSGLTVRGGQSADTGGAIHVAGTLVLSDVIIEQNVAATSGGGVHSANADMVVLNTLIRDNEAADGGGIFVAGGAADIEASTIAQNLAGNGGGGIYASGTVELVNSTISGNQADGALGGGGIYNDQTVRLMNVTLHDNSAPAGEGGGLRNANIGLAEMKNSIAGGNTAAVSGPDLRGSITSGGYNLIQSIFGWVLFGDTTGVLINVDPLLGPLAERGGPTPTHPLLPGSPALNAADPNDFPATDQRGVPRPQGAAADMGAVEVAVGVLGFAEQNVTVPAGETSVTLTVLRSAGWEGAVTVDFATADGTAIAGVDYLADSGTLSFADGQVSQQITITILDNELAEDERSFEVVLSNPTGGAALGAVTTATVTLADPTEPPIDPPVDPPVDPPDDPPVGPIITGRVVVAGFASRGGSEIRIFDADTGELLHAFQPYGTRFNRAITIALADVTGDGVLDIITAPGRGRVGMRVFSGATGEHLDGPLHEVHPFGPRYRGGIFVAAGDINGNGVAEIVVGQASRRAVVRVLDAATAEPVAWPLGSLAPFGPGFRQGATVALGDVTGDGNLELIVGMHRRGNQVNVHSTANGALLGSFAAHPVFRGGVFVGVADIDGDGRQEILTTTRSRAGGSLRVFNQQGVFQPQFTVPGFGQMHFGPLASTAPDDDVVISLLDPAAARISIHRGADLELIQSWTMELPFRQRLLFVAAGEQLEQAQEA